jgi:hypothetical protein
MIVFLGVKNLLNKNPGSNSTVRYPYLRGSFLGL